LIQTGRMVSWIHDLTTWAICLPLFYEAHSITLAPSSADEIEGSPYKLPGPDSPEEGPTTLYLFLSFSGWNFVC
jgi:hypothetical protein